VADVWVRVIYEIHSLKRRRKRKRGKKPIIMVARRGGQTIVGQPGTATVSASGATLQGQDVNGAPIVFVLTPAARGTVSGEVRVAGDPPETISLKPGRQ